MNKKQLAVFVIAIFAFLCGLGYITTGCSSYKKYDSYMINRGQLLRWKENDVRIIHVDTLDNGYYDVYVK